MNSHCTGHLLVDWLCDLSDFSFDNRLVDYRLHNYEDVTVGRREVRREIKGSECKIHLGESSED